LLYFADLIGIAKSWLLFKISVQNNKTTIKKTNKKGEGSCGSINHVRYY
jgi:hypothetical protein